MRYLIGNGQPGKIRDMESILKLHGDKINEERDARNKVIWICFGVLAALQFLQANGLFTENFGF